MIIIDWKRAANGAVNFSCFCVAFVSLPLLMIFCLNTLFGLGIAYSLDTFCAAAMLISIYVLLTRG